MKGHERAEAVRQTLDSVARGVSDPLARGIAKLSAALCGYWEGRWAEVSELATAAGEVFASEVLEGAWEVALARSIRSTVDVHMGQLYASRSELAVARRDAIARNDQYALLNIDRNLASTYLMSDDVQNAAHLLRELERRLAGTPLSPMHVLMTSSFVALHLYQGEPRLAAARLEAGYRESAQLGMLRFPLVRLLLLGMRADCVAAEAHSSARGKAKQLDLLARKAERVPIAWSAPLAHSLRAQSEALLRNVPAALRAAELARAGFEQQGLRVAAAIERVRCAELSGSPAQHGALRDLEAFGLKAPARWPALVRSLY